MTYYSLQALLKENGYSTYREKEIGLTGTRTTALIMDTPPISMEDKLEKLRRLLFGMPVVATKFPNEAFIKLVIKKAERNVE